jgi:hypothetical protein
MNKALTALIHAAVGRLGNNKTHKQLTNLMKMHNIE